MAVQQANFAGSFYTSEPIPLNRQVRLLTQGGRVGASIGSARPIAVIAPHAGYRFSGHLAGEAYAAALHGDMEHNYLRTLVLSPSHKYAFEGLAVPSWKGFRVPNGHMGVDKTCVNDLVDRKMVQVLDEAHENEHGIETQIPFLTRYFTGAPIVPIVVGQIKPDVLGKVIDFVAGDPELPTLVVLSSDLSHFHDLTHAKRLDAATAQMIEMGDIRGLDGTHACGWRPIAGFLSSKLGAGAKAVRLGMADSSRVTLDESRVVGYGAWSFYRAHHPVFSDQRRKALLNAARQGLTSFLRKGKKPEINMDTFGPPLHTTAASFVTLTHNGRLRGCIGSLKAHQPLVKDVIENAIKAGTQDRRFKALTTPDQMDDLVLKIAVLTKPAPLSFANRAELEKIIRPGISGLILEDQGKRGTFLPMVWDSLKSPQEFLDGLVVKAGLPKGHWSDTVRIWHFETESFSEADYKE
ncbi:MAG: AmmeMemoRadiSam system protein B [Planktomarina sp.]